MRVVRSRTQFTAREAVRRNHGSWRVMRTPPTQSKPASSAATIFAISSGGFCRSASSVTTYRPRVCRKPARRAACWPKLRRSSTTRVTLDGVRTARAGAQRNDRHCRHRRTRPRSVRCRASSAAYRRSKSCGRQASSLKTGITMLSCGADARSATSRCLDSAATVNFLSPAQRYAHAVDVGVGHRRKQRQADGLAADARCARIESDR